MYEMKIKWKWKFIQTVETILPAVSKGSIERAVEAQKAEEI